MIPFGESKSTKDIVNANGLLNICVHKDSIIGSAFNKTELEISLMISEMQCI